MKQILTKTAILPLLILTIFASIFLGWKLKSDLHQLKIGFIDEHKAETEKQSKEIQSKLNFLYQSIRTMSFIPSVRKVNRHGENLDDDAKATLQQLFNNAYQDIQMSEIYVIPSSLDPDKIDPVTKKNEEPIITFDEFITTDAPKKAEEEKKPELEEVEYFEYVQMKKQLEYFAQNYSTRDKIKDLEVPMLASEIVITCDNAEFSKADLEAKNDEPRKGIVFTVPVYDFNGKLHGGVSAVLRTNILRSYLDAHMASAIVNMENHITIGKKNDSTEWLSALPYFKKSETNPNLIFSSIQKINFGEKSDWQIWYAQNDEEFWILPEVKAAKTQFWILQIVVWGLFAAATAFMIRKWRLSLRVERIVDNLTNSVEGLASASKQVSETSIELQSSASQQNKAIDSVASAINQINSTIEKTADLGRQLQEQAQNSQNASQNGQQAVQDMVAINNQLAEAFTEIIKQIEQNKNHFFDMQKMFETIKTKTKVIDEIVFQTRLLSFNASVEAARAGEFGKGFAVVAEEIGNLAKMSGDSAHEIAEVITEGTSQVEVLVAETTKSVDVMTEQFNQQIHQSKSASESGHQALEALVQQVAQFFEMAVQLSQATNEQSSGVNEILNSIQNVNAMSDKNSAISDESTQVANHLKAQAETISSQIKYLQKLMSAKVQERSDKPDDELAS